MSKKTLYIYRVILGVFIIGAVLFFAFRFLFKLPAFMKVLALGLVVLTIYLVVKNLIEHNKKKKNE
tara:strand:- start:238 stop:435 length:198 start_codon:yes stop_codon:yes gene_type:complete